MLGFANLYTQPRFQRFPLWCWESPVKRYKMGAGAGMFTNKKTLAYYLLPSWIGHGAKLPQPQPTTWLLTEFLQLCFANEIPSNILKYQDDESTKDIYESPG